MENTLDKRKLFYLILPLIVLFVYDRIGDVVIFIIQEAFHILSVSEAFTSIVAESSLCRCNRLRCRWIGNHLVEFCRFYRKDDSFYGK